VKKLWTDRAWEGYLYYQAEDRKTLNRLNQIIQDIDRGGYEGIGNPEPLTGNLTGYWSRRITKEHRLVYRLTKDGIEIVSCRFHYSK